VQLSEGFELTEHSLNELGNGRVDMWLRGSSACVKPTKARAARNCLPLTKLPLNPIPASDVHAAASGAEEHFRSPRHRSRPRSQPPGSNTLPSAGRDQGTPSSP